MHELLIPRLPSQESERMIITDRRRVVTSLARTLVLLPPCILIGLIGALLLSCPDRGTEKRKQKLGCRQYPK